MSYCLIYYKTNKIKEQMINQPLRISLVQAPNKLTTFKCGPRWIRILSSDTRDSSEVGFNEDLIILTATVLT